MKFLTSKIFFLCWISVVGQDKDISPDQFAFDNALEAYYDEEYDSALHLFNDLLKTYPNSSLAPRTKYNIGYILRELERDEESIPIFIEILNSDYNEKERFGGLMEQYALYKNRSASHLSEIYLDRKQFEDAKKYIRLFDKKYKYQHFGGNEMMANEIYTAIQYAKLYDGLEKTEKAIRIMLPYIFDNGLASNDLLLELLSLLLTKQYSEQELSTIVTEAKSSLKILSKDKATIVFLRTKIKVSDFQLFYLGNPEFEENLELNGNDKWQKVLNTHPILGKY